MLVIYRNSVWSFFSRPPPLLSSILSTSFLLLHLTCRLSSLHLRLSQSLRILYYSQFLKIHKFASHSDARQIIIMPSNVLELIFSNLYNVLNDTNIENTSRADINAASKGFQCYKSSVWNQNVSSFNATNRLSTGRNYDRVCFVLSRSDAQTLLVAPDLARVSDIWVLPRCLKPGIVTEILNLNWSDILGGYSQGVMKLKCCYFSVASPSSIRPKVTYMALVAELTIALSRSTTSTCQHSLIPSLPSSQDLIWPSQNWGSSAVSFFCPPASSVMKQVLQFQLNAAFLMWNETLMSSKNFSRSCEILLNSISFPSFSTISALAKALASAHNVAFARSIEVTVAHRGIQTALTLLSWAMFLLRSSIVEIDVLMEWSSQHAFWKLL